MKFSTTFFIVFILLCSNKALAIDTYAKVKKERPENLNIDNPRYSASKAILAEFTLTSDNIPLNKIHTWTLTLTHKSGRSISHADIVISPDMPEHLHGMTTKPVAIATDEPGKYLLKGMNFHMPGWWKVTLDISGYGSRDLVRFNVIVGEDELNTMQHNQHKHH